MTHLNKKSLSKSTVVGQEESELSDAEVFRFMKKQRQEVRAERRDKWETMNSRGELPKGWVRHTDTHYSYTLNGKKLDYWPGPKKWQYEGKIVHGEVLDYIARKTK